MGKKIKQNRDDLNTSIFEINLTCKTDMQNKSFIPFIISSV